MGNGFEGAGGDAVSRSAARATRSSRRIDQVYNRRRRHSAGYLDPATFERNMIGKAADVAALNRCPANGVNPISTKTAEQIK